MCEQSWRLGAPLTRRTNGRVRRLGRRRLRGSSVAMALAAAGVMPLGSSRRDAIAPARGAKGEPRVAKHTAGLVQAVHSAQPAQRAESGASPRAARLQNQGGAAICVLCRKPNPSFMCGAACLRGQVPLAPKALVKVYLGSKAAEAEAWGRREPGYRSVPHQLPIRGNSDARHSQNDCFHVHFRSARCD